MSFDYDDNQAKSGPALNKKAAVKKRRKKATSKRTAPQGMHKESSSKKGGTPRSTARKNNVSKNGQKGSKPKSRGRRRKNKKQGIGSMVVLVAAVCVFAFSLFQLIMQLLPYYSGGQEYEDVKRLAITTEKEDGKEARFLVDFDALLAENADTIAWIRFDEPSVISYPVVKSADNEEYLTKTFSANDNKLGAIFMDMRNDSGFADQNTFIYGHNLKVGGEMFSQLNEYASEEFCKQHPYFYIYTPDGNVCTYQIFSAAVVKDTAENYEMTFATGEEYVKYLEMCKATSNYPVDVSLDASSKIVSLSTCTNVNDDERFLVQGVLVNKEVNE